jgi:hypothetical protein
VHTGAAFPLPVGREAALDVNQTSIHINGAGRYENAEIEYVVFVLRSSAP